MLSSWFYDISSFVCISLSLLYLHGFSVCFSRVPAAFMIISMSNLKKLLEKLQCYHTLRSFYFAWEEERHWYILNFPSDSLSYYLFNLLVEVLEEYEAGGGAYDGGQPPDGGCVGDAQGEAFADHVVVPGLVPVLGAQAEIRGLGGQHQDLSLWGDTVTRKAGDQKSSPACSNARVTWEPEKQQVCVERAGFSSQD